MCKLYKLLFLKSRQRASFKTGFSEDDLPYIKISLLPDSRWTKKTIEIHGVYAEYLKGKRSLMLHYMQPELLAIQQKNNPLVQIHWRQMNKWIVLLSTIRQKCYGRYHYLQPDGRMIYGENGGGGYIFTIDKNIGYGYNVTVTVAVTI